MDGVQHTAHSQRDDGRQARRDRREEAQIAARVASGEHTAQPNSQGVTRRPYASSKPSFHDTQSSSNDGRRSEPWDRKPLPQQPSGDMDPGARNASVMTIDNRPNERNEMVEAAFQANERAQERAEKAERENANLKDQLQKAVRDLNMANKARVAAEERDQINDNAARHWEQKWRQAESVNAARSQTLETEYRTQLELRDVQNQELLNAVTRGKGEGRWNPPQDDSLRVDLDNLHSTIRDWCKTWAAKTVNLQDKSAKELVKYIQPFVQLNGDGSLPISLCKPTGRLKEKVPYVLLNAALAHEIQERFFSFPFLCLPYEYQAAFHAVHREIEEVDEIEAHMWRCSLWRLLSAPKTGTPGPAAAKLYKETNKRIQKYCDDLDSNFRKGPADMLMKIVSSKEAIDDRASKLRKILMSAAEIAQSLWTQRSYLDAYDLEHIQECKIAYKAASPQMRVHPLTGIDVDDNSRDGDGVLVVTRPGLLIFDEDDRKGIKGDGYRVLIQAMVLLADRDDGLSGTLRRSTTS